MNFLSRAGLTALLITGTLVWSVEVRAQSLPELLLDLVQTHDRIKAAKNDLQAAQTRISETRGAWYPELDVTVDNGFQKRHNPGTNDTTKKFNDTSISVTQLLWDFGKTNSDIAISEKNRDTADVALTGVRQDLILDGIVAYVRVFEANKRVKLAIQSENNIKKQTELEDARVASGAGYSTDVLQAKTELAEAQSRRVVAEGSLRSALSRFNSLFKFMPRDVDGFKPPALPEMLMPRTLDEAITIGLKENPTLRRAQFAADVAKATIDRTRQDLYFPEISAVVESNHEYNLDGTLGQRDVQEAKVELSFPFNLGGQAFDTVSVSRSSYKAAVDRYADARRTAEEDIRSAWADLMTAKENHEVRTAQIGIAQKFLELARQEREAGRRSLLDVLSGETRLINAQSDAVITQSAIVQSAYRLLNRIGRLELSAIEAK